MVDEPRENYDLVSAVFLGLRTDPLEDLNPESIIDMLSVLVSEYLTPTKKIHISEHVFGIPMSIELKEDIDIMCNYSAGVAERAMKRGIEQGRSEGLEQGRCESIRNLIKNLRFTVLRSWMP